MGAGCCYLYAGIHFYKLRILFYSLHGRGNFTNSSEIEVRKAITELFAKVG